jgi:hypothetical protein
VLYLLTRADTPETWTTLLLRLRKPISVTFSV